MRRRRAPLALAASALALGACGANDERLPDACTEGPAAVRHALAAAPGKVRLSGVPLSNCLRENADAAELQTVGAAFTNVAGELSQKAIRDPESEEALRLGYLLGAARRGAAHTQGIHSELVHRLEQKVTTVDRHSDALGRGERAGRRWG